MIIGEDVVGKYSVSTINHGSKLFLGRQLRASEWYDIDSNMPIATERLCQEPRPLTGQVFAERSVLMLSTVSSLIASIDTRKSDISFNCASSSPRRLTREAYWLGSAMPCP